jgi:hypothetical protein
MAKIGKIAPVIKAYDNDAKIKTLDQQLAKHGLTRAPGTYETFLPYKEASGKYRTGLDVHAPYLQRLSEEDRVAEIERITKDKERLEKDLGVPGILDPTSIFYNFAASREQIKARFGGSELQTAPIRLGEKEEYFDTSNVLKEIEWNWLKVHPRIAPSLNNVPADVKYYIVDDESQAREIFNKNREVNKAIIAFDALTPTKKKQIARLMNQPVTEDTTEEVVYNLVDALLKEKTVNSGSNKGMNPIRLFNELLKTTDGRIEVKDLVKQAITHSIYRFGKGGKIEEGGRPIANTEDELVEWLLDEENQLDLIALKDKLKVKKLAKE